MNRRIIGLAFGLILVALIGYAVRQQMSSGKSNSLLQEASPEEILTHIREMQSPLVVVNFWASWCEPCKVEFPYLLTLKDKFAAQGLRLVLVSIDHTADFGAAAEFLKAQKVDFQTFYKGDQPLKFVSQIYPEWTGAVPTTLLLGPDLKILDAWEGDTSLSEFEQRITPHLKGS